MYEPLMGLMMMQGHIAMHGTMFAVAYFFVDVTKISTTASADNVNAGNLTANASLILAGN